MNNFDTNGFHNDRTNGATISLPMHQSSNDRKLKKRRRNSSESTHSHDNVTPEWYKKNLICILSAVIVVLIAALCYTLIMLFEEKTHAADQITDDILEKSLPSEQHNWHKIGINELRQSVKYEHNKNKAKNVILFVGDGMGISTVTATRIYKYGEDGALSWESFPHAGLLKTYCVDKQVCDSASTATALFGGIKSNYETSGVDGFVRLNDCKASLNKSHHVESILKWAQDANKATGFVTTTRVVHATPSALYAHTANRKWECETKIKISDRDQGCKDIARQLIEDYPGRNINVIMGGGRQCLVSNVSDTPADPIDHWSCISSDGRDLIRDWALDKEKRKLRHATAANNEELEQLDTQNVDYVLGVFANGHLKYDHERDTGPKGMPSLMNMTEQALKILKRNSNGFVLVVEGGMIDQAHHRGYAHRALSEAAAMDDAVKRTLEIMKSDLDETLIIVTADHDHSLTINGYPDRGNNILGIARKSKYDDVPYTTLLYATGGPDAVQMEITNDGKIKRKDPTKDDTATYTYIQQAAIQSDENAHAGSDVSIHAIGPMSHLIQRVHEQSYVAYLISYAARIGHFRNL